MTHKDYIIRNYAQQCLESFGREEFKRIQKNPNWKVENPMTIEEKQREFEKTIQRLINRNRDLNIIILFVEQKVL